MSDKQQAWRKAIADQVRRNCTPSSEAYAAGGDTLIAAVADWIENPPEWSHFEEPERPAGRPHVVLGQHSITLDGERLRGVRSVKVVNDVRDLPIVRIDILPASVQVVDLVSTVPKAPEA